MKDYHIMNLCDYDIDAAIAIKLVKSEMSISQLIDISNDFYSNLNIKKEEIIIKIKYALVNYSHDILLSTKVLLYFVINSSIVNALCSQGLIYLFSIILLPEEILKKKYNLTLASIKKIN